MTRLVVSSAVGVLLVLLSWAPTLAQDRAKLERRGKLLLESNCSACHAVGRTGASPHRTAPPFRTLGQNYAIESLAEALAEGLSTGHPDMPEFVFETPEVSAILTYLQSIQVPRTTDNRNR